MAAPKPPKFRIPLYHPKRAAIPEPNRWTEDWIVNRLMEWLKQEPRFYTTLDGTREFGWLMNENDYKHLRYLLTAPPLPRGRTPFDSGYTGSASRRADRKRLYEDRVKKIIAETGKVRGARTRARKELAEELGVSEETVKYWAKTG
jgi:hypothetical protein